MDHQRSYSNPNILNNTVSPGQLIKFPTITKLFYDGDNSQIGHKTLFKLTNAKVSTKNSFGIPSSQKLMQDKNFRVVQVPSDNYIMKICVMNINQPQVKYKSVNKQQSQNNFKTAFSKTLVNKQKSSSLFTNIGFRKDNQLLVNKTASIQKVSEITQQSEPKLRNRTQSLTKFRNMNLPINKININDIYFQVISALALVNGKVIVNQLKSFQKIRRAKIQKGNNGYLVKQTIKKRSWWNTAEQINQANLIWTQKQLKNIQHNEQRQKFYFQISEQQQKKVFIQRNIDQVLTSYPKMLQLFFTQFEIYKMTKCTNNHENKSKKSYKIYNYFNNLKAQKKIIPQNTVIYNHIPNHHQITSKKMLYKNLWRYYLQNQKDPYEYIPKTYHLTAFDWQQKLQFIKYEQKNNINKQPKGISQAWFLKPGENTNRGKGIQMFKSTNQVLDYIMRNPPKTINRTYIIQEYINPMLYDGRKFDIRCYLLCVQVFNTQSFYWFQQGYIRTSSSKFTMNKTSISIHLTNDAVQKQFDNYDKYESANKLSYLQLDKYIKNQYGYDFLGQIVPRMKSIATDVCKSALQMGERYTDEQDNDQQDQNVVKKVANKKKQKQKQRRDPKYEGIYFELFGLDFIIQKQGHPFLLQVNTNPCLQTNSNLLSRIIPQVVQNTFRIVIDVYMPHKSHSSNNNNNASANNNIGNNASSSIICPDWAQSFLVNNKFSLIYRRQFESSQKTAEQLKAQIKKQQSQDLKKLALNRNQSEKLIGQNRSKDSFFKFGNSSSRYTPQFGKY